MSKIEGIILVLAIGILSLLSGLKAKDRYFKGQYIVLSFVLIIGAVLALISSLPSTPTKVNQLARDTAVQKNKNSSATNTDSTINDRTKIRFIPASDLPIPKK